MESNAEVVNTSKKDLNTSIEKDAGNKKSDEKLELGEMELQLLTLIRKNSTRTMEYMSSHSGLSRTVVQYMLNVLRSKCVITREESKKKGMWVIHG